MSLIEENDSRHVRMGHLAFLGSHRVNGVSALHTELMRKTVFRDLHALYPDRIVNKTNGITFRRWLYPGESRADRAHRRRRSARRPGRRRRGSKRSCRSPTTPAFRERFAAVRRANKVALARLVAERLGVGVDPDALFDVQIKRIHEYKRQLLNILETIALYNAMRAQPTRDWVPRVKIFAGKAAAGYQQAKLIIKLANDVARVVNNDPAVRGLLKVVFLPNYNVSLAEAIIPAADLSEQISTAGMEASGTGNMKLALNGALTIGTLDGANIEIRERVGAENIFIFGLTADEVAARRARGHRRDRDDRRVARARRGARRRRLGRVLAGRPQRATAASSTALRHHDYFMVTADFDAYRDDAARGRPRCGSDHGAMVAHGDPQHGARWAGSRRTARFASMRSEIWHAEPGMRLRRLRDAAARACPRRHDRRDRRGPPRRSVRGARPARGRRRARRPRVRPRRRARRRA